MNTLSPKPNQAFGATSSGLLVPLLFLFEYNLRDFGFLSLSNLAKFSHLQTRGRVHFGLAVKMLTKMTKTITRLAIAITLSFASLLPVSSANAGKEADHRVILHVNGNDKAHMNVVLSNASNIANFFTKQGKSIQVEVVANGPGLKMLTAQSPVAERVKSISKNSTQVSFHACSKSHKMLSKKAGKDLVMLSVVNMVPAGMPYIMSRQEQGWSYIKP